MKEIIVTLPDTAESKQIVDWLNANDSTEYQALIGECRIMKAANSKPLSYLLSRVVEMVAVAPNPEADEFQRAESVRQLVKAVVLQASQAGIKEVWFRGDDAVLNRMAERHEFEKVEGPVFRLRIP